MTLLSAHRLCNLSAGRCLALHVGSTTASGADSVARGGVGHLRWLPHRLFFLWTCVLHGRLHVSMLRTLQCQRCGVSIHGTRHSLGKRIDCFFFICSSVGQRGCWGPMGHQSQLDGWRTSQARTSSASRRPRTHFFCRIHSNEHETGRLLNRCRFPVPGSGATDESWVRGAGVEQKFHLFAPKAVGALPMAKRLTCLASTHHLEEPGMTR